MSVKKFSLTMFTFTLSLLCYYVFNKLLCFIHDRPVIVCSSINITKYADKYLTIKYWMRIFFVDVEIELEPSDEETSSFEGKLKLWMKRTETTR